MVDDLSTGKPEGNSTAQADTSVTMESQVRTQARGASTKTPESRKPKLMLMGQRQSGKSSISSVVFHKMPPSDTLFLESTARIQKESMGSFMDFQVWDFPGQIDVVNNPAYDMEAIFGEIGALIWVIDAQAEYLDAVASLNITILELQRTFPNINIEVFIHKVDGISEDFKHDIQRDIQCRVQDELSDNGIENAPISFHLTSIYSASIFEAFSRVIQKLVPHLGVLETLLTNLCRNCRMEKAYLFDVLSKIYIATDSTPVDMATYEICSDFIDVIIDISEVYGTWQRSDEHRKSLEAYPYNMRIEDQVACPWAESAVNIVDGNGKPLMLREVDRYLALVCINGEGTYDKIPVINLNVNETVKGIAEFFDITKPKAAGGGAVGHVAGLNSTGGGETDA